MRVKLIQIGNSVGVRLPKNVVQDCGFETEIEMNVQDKSVILTAPHDDRTAWNELFQESVAQKPVQEKGEWEW